MLTTLESSIINQTPSIKCKKENINELNFSPLRLLTEYRRKLILNSLCDFKDVNINRDIARKSVNNSLNYKVSNNNNNNNNNNRFYCIHMNIIFSIKISFFIFYTSFFFNF